MIKLALPVENDFICPHFGKCVQFYIVEIENNNIIRETLVDYPPHEPGLLPAWLAKNGVTDIIAVEMGQKAIGLFSQHKINVFIGVPVKKPGDLVSDYIHGTLETSDNTCEK